MFRVGWAMGFGSQDAEGASEGFHERAMNCFLQSSPLGSWSVLLPGCLCQTWEATTAPQEAVSSSDHGLHAGLGLALQLSLVPTGALGCELRSLRFWNSPVQTDLPKYRELLKAGLTWCIFEHLTLWPGKWGPQYLMREGKNGKDQLSYLGTVCTYSPHLGRSNLT